MFQVFQMQKGESSDEYVLGEPSMPDESKRVKKRNRVLQSCISCHQLRRKCDRQRPCTRCTEHGMGGQCVYQLEDPAVRQGPEQDELTRLRGRVSDLEHTVRVLMQRPLSKGATEALGLEVDETTLLLRKIGKDSGDSEGQGREKSRKIAGRVKAEDSTTRQSPGMPGMSNLSLAGSPTHCGCAYNQSGREYYVYLLSRIGETLQKLKGLPEHQQGLACFVLLRLSEAYESISTTLHSSAPTPYGYPTSTSMPATYNAQSFSTPFSPTSSSPPNQQPSISLSHPSSYNHQPSTSPSSGQPHAYHHQQPMQQPTYPYPYTSSSSHSPSSSSGTMGSTQHMSRQSQASAPATGHRGSALASSSQHFSTLSSWDSIGQQHPMSSRHAVRHGASRGGQYDPNHSSRGDGGR